MSETEKKIKTNIETKASSQQKRKTDQLKLALSPQNEAVRSLTNIHIFSM